MAKAPKPEEPTYMEFTRHVGHPTFRFGLSRGSIYYDYWKFRSLD